MNKHQDKILVTQPTLPDLPQYQKLLQQIWDNKWLTNNGIFHQEFEQKLADYLGVPYVSLFSNGTIALMVALKALDIQGEVITTPYTFVATSHSLLWNNNTPVFADVDPVYGNLSVAEVEKHITDKTTAIMPVHVYGNPVDIEGFERLAKKYNLKIIYDAAHAFGVQQNGKSILNYGDLSILSFHATKTFNTVEGGAIISHDLETKKQIDYLKNFGFENETSVVTLGINGKMNELIAAFGLLQLENIDRDITKRQKVADLYREALSGIKGIRFLDDKPEVRHNYSYFPIFVEPDYPLTRDELYEKLKANNIFGRRYFYPLVSDFPMYQHLPTATKENLPVAHRLAEQVICLPMYAELNKDTIQNIVNLILEI